MALEFGDAALAATIVASGIAARARIACCDEGEARWESDGACGARHDNDAILEWLSEGVESVARKEREFVEKEDSAMCETDLSWPWPSATADESSDGDGVMGGAERALWLCAECGGVGREHSGDRVNGEDFEGLVVVERGEDSGQSAREHRFASAGWTKEQQVVSACGSDLECSGGEFLTDDVAEVWCVVGRRNVWANALFVAEETVAQGGDEFVQGAWCGGSRVGDAQCFGEVVGWHNEQCTTGVRDVSSDGEYAAHGAQLSIESEFTNRAHALQRIGRELSAGCEQGEGDGKIECSSRFRCVGGLEIDDDAFWRHRESRVGQRRPDAVAALLHCRRGQSDECPLWQPIGYVHFDEDIEGVYSEDGGGVCGGEHGVSVVRVGAIAVTVLLPR